MDERQTQIVEGAGLEDSRINREFLDLIQKWSTPVLLVVLVLAGGYAGVKYLERQRVKNLDAAFVSFVDAELEQRPERLIEIAGDSSGQGAVPAMARLTAADLYLQAYQLRTRPGTLGDAEEDKLDDAQAQEMLAKAGEVYTEVYNDVKDDDGKALLAMGSRWGMVAVALSQQRFDEAQAGLSEIISVADQNGFSTLADDARALLETLPDLREQRQPVAEAPEVPEDAPERQAEDAPGEEGAPAEDAPDSDPND